MVRLCTGWLDRRCRLFVMCLNEAALATYYTIITTLITVLKTSLGFVPVAVEPTLTFHSYTEHFSLKNDQ